MHYNNDLPLIIVQPLAAPSSTSSPSSPLAIDHLVDYRDFDHHFHQHHHHHHTLAVGCELHGPALRKAGCANGDAAAAVLVLGDDQTMSIVCTLWDSGDNADSADSAVVVCDRKSSSWSGGLLLLLLVDRLTWSSCRALLLRNIRHVHEKEAGIAIANTDAAGTDTSGSSVAVPVIDCRELRGMFTQRGPLKPDAVSGCGDSSIDDIPVLQRVVLMPLFDAPVQPSEADTSASVVTMVTRDTLLALDRTVYYVVDCAPLISGRIDDDGTSLVVIRGEQPIVRSLLQRFNLHTEATERESLEIDSVPAYSAFLSNRSPAMWKCSLVALDHTVLKGQSVVDGIDANHVVFLSQQQLARWQLFDGSWCWLRTRAHTERRRLVYVKEYTPEVHHHAAEGSGTDEDNSIHASHHLLFQLMRSDYFHLVGYEVDNDESNGHTAVDAMMERVDMDTDEAGDISSNTMPRIASEVVLIPVTSPNRFTLDENHCPDNAMKHFFSSCKRILHEGDVIAIPHFFDNCKQVDDVETLNSQWQLQKLDPLRPMVSYFMVATVEGGETVDVDRTRLISGSGRECQSYLPPSHGPQTHDTNDAPVLAKGDTYDALDALFSACVYQSYAIHDRGEKRQKGMPALVPSILIYGNKGTGKQHTVSMLASRYGMHLLDVSCYELLGEQDQQTQEHLSQIFSVADQCRPCVMFWRHFEALAQEDTTLPSHMKASKIRLVHAIEQHLEELGKSTSPLPVLLICSTSSNSLDHLMPIFRQKIFMEKLRFPANMNIAQWREMMHTKRNRPGVDAMDVSLQWMESEMGIGNSQSSVSFGDVRTLQQHATSHALFRMSSTNAVRQREDYDYAMKRLHGKRSKLIGAPEVPHVTWEDVGGLEEAKQEVLDTIQLPLLQPELFEGRNRRQRSGVLLYGPPGTGKTLLAKAVATECSLNFMSVKGPELLNMYIGESEKNIRDVFERARESAPCVIFFDELDALAPNRGASGDSGGVMDRITSQLLAELDGLHSSRSVFVIGATNRPDLLDSALLRPGRFDRMVYLGISGNKEDQYKIIRALTRKFTFEEETPDEEREREEEEEHETIIDELLHDGEGPRSNVDGTERILREIAERCPMNFTGADFYALCSDAFMKALMEVIEQGGQDLLEKSFDDGKGSDDDNEAMPAVRVGKRHFLDALQHLTPSISEQELQRYRTLQQTFKK